MRKLYLALECNPVVVSLAWMVDKIWLHLVLPSLHLSVLSFLFGLALTLVFGTGMILGFWDFNSLGQWITSLRKF